MTIKTVNMLWDEYKARRVVGMKTAKERERIYETYIRAPLGSKNVLKVHFETLDTFHVGMKEMPVQANRIMSLLRSMFKFAQALRWLPPGYTAPQHVKLFPEHKRRRHLTPAEAPRIATAIRNLEDIHPSACLFLWLLIFTGARPGEIHKARWMDKEGNVITITEHKTDYTGVPRVITLPPAALDKIHELFPFAGHPKARIINDTYSNLQFVWNKVRIDAKCSDLRMYDLRHTFATYALENGYSLDQIGEALGHSNAQTTKIYAEMNLRSRKKMAGDVHLAILKDMNIEALL